MGDITDYLVPIIAGFVFVSTAIVGFCLYYCYFKSRRGHSKQSGRIEDSVKRSHGAHGTGKHAQFSSYNLHSNPLIFYMGPAPFEFTNTSLAAEERESARSSSSPCHFAEEYHCVKLPERKRVCRTTSNENSARSPCHLQVITEADEEVEEEEDEGELYKTAKI